MLSGQTRQHLHCRAMLRIPQSSGRLTRPVLEFNPKIPAKASHWASPSLKTLPDISSSSIKPRAIVWGSRPPVSLCHWRKLRNSLSFVPLIWLHPSLDNGPPGADNINSFITFLCKHEGRSQTHLNIWTRWRRMFLRLFAAIDMFCLKSVIYQSFLRPSFIERCHESHKYRVYHSGLQTWKWNQCFHKRLYSSGTPWSGWDIDKQIPSGYWQFVQV